jgi:hypothetical protein
LVKFFSELWRIMWSSQNYQDAHTVTHMLTCTQLRFPQLKSIVSLTWGKTWVRCEIDSAAGAQKKGKSNEHWIIAKKKCNDNMCTFDQVCIQFSYFSVKSILLIIKKRKYKLSTTSKITFWSSYVRDSKLVRGWSLINLKPNRLWFIAKFKRSDLP